MNYELIMSFWRANLMKKNFPALGCLLRQLIIAIIYFNNSF